METVQMMTIIIVGSAVITFLRRLRQWQQGVLCPQARQGALSSIEKNFRGSSPSWDGSATSAQHGVLDLTKNLTR